MVDNSGYPQTYKTINTTEKTAIEYIIASKSMVLAIRSDYKAYIYNIDVTTIEDGSTVTADLVLDVGSPVVKAFLSSLEKVYLRDLNNSKSIAISFQKDTKNILALKYKDEYFYSMKGNVLSAGGPDVRAGKTFIGWLGTPETGTLEV